MSVRFHLHRRKDTKTRERTLRVHVNRFGRQVTVSLPMQFKPGEWSQALQQQRGKGPGVKTTNANLRQLKHEIEALSLQHPHDDAALRQAILHRIGNVPQKKEPTLFEHLEVFLSDKKVEVAESTMKVFRTMERHLKEFLPEDVPVKDLSPRLVTDFQKHLLDEKLNNNSANKYAARLRSFVLWLEENGVIEAAPKMKSLKTAQSEVVRLTLAELEALRAVDLSKEQPGYTKARDVFLFSAYTGLRFSDCMALTWDHIGEDALFLAEGKTGRFRRIPMTDAAREILDRYEGQKTPLPKISNQKANVFIREVAKLAKLNAPVVVRDRKGGDTESESVAKHEALSMHAGRRSFISAMMESGISTKELLGVTHTDLRSLQRYAAASEDHLRQAMKGAFVASKAEVGS